MLALIMAGGSGTRFWPKSRKKHPKQLLSIYGKETMLQQTVNRLKPAVPVEKIFIVSTQSQIEEIQKQLPQIPPQNIIVEPVGKNTAPCIGLGALYMRRVDPEEVMVVLPADHLITKEELWLQQLQQAEAVARHTNALVTIGIRPSYPSTGYGYIQFTNDVVNIDSISAYKVKTFAEKPNYETACRFLESGDFLWNSGIFIWKISTILREIEEHLPEIHDALNKIDQAIGTPKEKETIDFIYRQIRSISIDYGVMEYAKEVYVLAGNFGWNDLGSWNEVYEIQPKDEQKNVAKEHHVLLDTRGCLVDVNNKVVAAIGLKDMIIVDTEDAMLICPRDRAQDVREVVEALKRKKMDHLL
ncbi:MAG: mannose-1-phosphate guanylyltransferase [Calditrichaeota bacterium]|nr:MAG: mannose-1-phosphate guanylyltransferase [Calditrichota bacterium]